MIYCHCLCLYFLQSGVTLKEETPATFRFTTMGSITTPAPGTVPSPRGTVRHGVQQKHQILVRSSSGAIAKKDAQLKVAMY